MICLINWNVEITVGYSLKGIIYTVVINSTKIIGLSIRLYTSYVMD